MAYDQYGGNYPPQQRSYYNQPPPPRGQSRGAMQPQRGPDPYAYPQAGYGQSQDRYQQQQGRVDNYAGYDTDDILDQYGDEEQDQQGYGQQGAYGYGGQNAPRGPPPPQQQRPGPQQYREPPQRRDNYGQPQQGYGNGMNGSMGPPGGRGRGAPPPRNYPPQQRGYPPQQGYGPPQRAYTSPQGNAQGYDDRQQYPQYDDQAQYQGQQNTSPPRNKPQERLLMQPTSPANMPLDNPFPTFPSSQPVKPMNNEDIAERAMAGMDLNARSSQESRRPSAGSQQSQNTGRPSLDRQQSNGRYGGPSRTSEDGYGSQPPFGGPQRSMTMPQNDPRAFPDRGYDGGAYGRGPQDPIPQRSFTSVGDRPGMNQPPRPSTATGTRPPGNNMYPGPRNNFPADPFAQGQPPRNAMPQRPGTSQGYREGPGPMQRPPMSKEAQLEAYMPDFDAQAPQGQPLQDAIGLPLDAAPEAGTGNAPYDMHKAKSQPDLRGQANGYAPNDYPEPVPKMPPMDVGGLSGQRRSPPRQLMTDPSQMPPRPGYQQVASPSSPRQFHRPGAPPIMRQGTMESAFSDPGPGARQGTPLGGPGMGPPSRSMTMDARQGTPVGGPGMAPPGRPMNPDALPAHPAPVRPGLNGARPGAASIRQEQAQRMSGESMQDNRRQSAPITVQELYRLREAVKAQPQNQAQQLHLVKKLVEAAAVLSDENGAADTRTTARNRENYVNEAYKLVKKLVAANYSEAIFYLADSYGTGDLGLSPDPKEAFVLYQSAAKLGHGQAAYRTAVCCEMGQENGGGTRKDPLKAVQWYRRAAALGDTPAMYKLGMILQKGHLGQAPNLGEAMIWLQRAANAADVDNPHALHELASLYETAPQGGKVIRDEKYALELYTQAAKLGYRMSQARLGAVWEYGQLGCAVDHRSSIHWYSKAAAQEDHDAELALSGWYLTGAPGILEQNDQEAYLWARKAALAENPKAEFAMGYFSETGIGCPKSFEDAKRWYGRAAGHRYPKARQRLEELMRTGSKGMKNKERISRSKNHEDCVVM